MKFFSDELSFSAVINNLKLGLRVVVEEWHWLFLSACYNSKKKYLEKKLAKSKDSEQDRIKVKLYELDLYHKEFRKKQITSRTS